MKCSTVINTLNGEIKMLATANIGVNIRKTARRTFNVVGKKWGRKEKLGYIYCFHTINQNPRGYS